MKKKLALILAGTAMAAMVLAGCGEKNNASGEDAKTAESVEDKKTFTVGFDAEYPPYGYMDEENTQDLIWSWQRQSVNWKAGSL